MAEKIDENGASSFKINHHLQLQIPLKPYSEQTYRGIFRFFLHLSLTISFRCQIEKSAFSLHFVNFGIIFPYFKP